MENKITCPDCRGLGWNIGSPANTSTSAKCDTCGGTGYVPYTQPEKHYKPMFSVEYGDAKKLAEENATLKAELREARKIIGELVEWNESAEVTGAFERDAATYVGRVSSDFCAKAGIMWANAKAYLNRTAYEKMRGERG